MSKIQSAALEQAHKRASGTVIQIVPAMEAACRKFEIIAMVMERTDLTGHEKVVFWVIANSISPGPWNKKAHAYWWIAKRAGITREYAIDCVQKLEAKSLIQVERRGAGSSNVYALVPLVNASPLDGEPQSTKSVNPSPPSKNSKTIKTESGRKSSFGSPVLTRHDPAELKRWFKMLNYAEARGEWPFEREPRSTIPSEVIAQWEREKGGANG